MSDTIESLGAELDAAERDRRGYLTIGDSWVHVLRRYVTQGCSSDYWMSIVPEWMAPFESRIRALLDASRKHRPTTHAELRAEARRLKRRVNWLVRKVRVAKDENWRLRGTHANCDADYQHAWTGWNRMETRADELHNLCADAMRMGLEECERLRDELGFATDDLHVATTSLRSVRSECDAAMRVVEAFRAWAMKGAPINGKLIEAVDVALLAFDASATMPSPRDDTAEGLGAELAREPACAFADAVWWPRCLTAWVTSREPVGYALRHCDIPEPLKARVRAWITAERAKLSR